MKNWPIYGRIPVDYAPMQDLSIDIKTMPQAFRGYHLLLVITYDQTNFMIAVPLRDRMAQTVAEALIYRVIYLFGPPRQIICDEATEFSSAIIQAILCMFNCRLKVISPYNHGSSKCKRQIRMISEIIMKHLWDKGQTFVISNRAHFEGSGHICPLSHKCFIISMACIIADENSAASSQIICLGGPNKYITL